MKKLLLLALLGAAALPGFGQGRDTVFAVHKLFRQKRGGAEVATATGLAGTAGAALGTPSYTSPRLGSGGDVAAILATGAVNTALGLHGQLRYSAQREADVLKLYAEGWGLPADIRRKLKRRHFKRTTKDVQAGL